MIVKLKKADSGYEILSRDAIQTIKDPTALAIWVYLMSKPEDWEVSGKDIEAHFGIGRDKRLKAIKYLEELGLYETKTIHDEKGRFLGKVAVVYCDADDNRKSEKPKVGKTESRKNRKSAEPKVGKSDPLHNTEYTHSTEYIHTPLTPQADVQASKSKQSSKKLPAYKPKGFVYPENFERLWSLYRVGDKWAAYKAYHRRSKEYDDETLERALRIEDKKEIGRRHFSTVLNGDLDELISSHENDTVARYGYDLSEYLR